MPQPPKTDQIKQHALLLAFKRQLKDQFPYVLANSDKIEPDKRTPVLLAISGGMDSMVLGRLLQEAGISAIWVHCNFHLRGEESNRDETFVREQAAVAEIPLIVKEFDTGKIATEWKMSIEETARKLRYDLFEAIIDKKIEGWSPLTVSEPAPLFLMTAHHAGDQVETLLLNFFRGCGISGLHGIPAKNSYILRPLLNFKRERLLSYATAKGLPWVEDGTNQSQEYTRNFLRHKILPELKQVYPAIEDTLLDNIQRLGQGEVLYQMGLEKYKKRLMNVQSGSLHLSVLLLQKSGIAATLLWEVLKSYGFRYRQIFEVEKLLFSDSGAYQDSASGKYRVLRNRAHLVVTPLNEKAAEMILIEAQIARVPFEDRILTLSLQTGTDFKIISDPLVAQLDGDQIQFPLLLRKWKQGDYFYPLGMRKKKKVARFLIDQKVPMHQKNHVWVLESKGRIIWVVGYRLDDRFKLKKGTKNILKLKLQDTNDCLK